MKEIFRATYRSKYRLAATLTATLGVLLLWSKSGVDFFAFATGLVIGGMAVALFIKSLSLDSASPQERRGVMPYAISDATSLFTLESLPLLFRETFAQIPGVRVGDVNLVGTAPKALVLEIEWFSSGFNYGDFLNRQQQMHLTLHKLMMDLAISDQETGKILITPQSVHHSIALH